MKEVWEKQYDKKKPPWNYDDFDEDFREFLNKDFDGLASGSLLLPTVIDLGCGNGSQSHHIEKLGFRVTGTDVVNALEYDIGDFIIDDALDSKLNKKYDLILDRG